MCEDPIRSFIKHTNICGFCSVPGTVLGMVDVSMNKTIYGNLYSCGVYSPVRSRHVADAFMLVLALSHVQLFATPWTPPSRPFCPLNVLGKHMGVGCHFILQGIFPTQGSNPRLLHLRHWQADSFTTEPPGKPM